MRTKAINSACLAISTWIKKMSPSVERHGQTVCVSMRVLSKAIGDTVLAVPVIRFRPEPAAAWGIIHC